MRTRSLIVLMICFGVCFPYCSIAAGLGKAVVRGGGKSVARSLRRPIYRPKAFDLRRDRITPLRTLKQERTVDRYTRSATALTELKRGISPNRHMTSISTRRPLTASSAKLRLGLPTKPDVVERITVPKGTPLHFNKVVGGKPGYGEITAPSRLPSSSIRRVIKLKP
jgi:hypothetical protein